MGYFLHISFAPQVLLEGMRVQRSVLQPDSTPDGKVMSVRMSEFMCVHAPKPLPMPKRSVL